MTKRSISIGFVLITITIIFIFIGIQANTVDQLADTTRQKQTEHTNSNNTTVGFTLGKKDAPVTVVEYADFLCPYCAQFHNEVMPKLKREYIDTGKVKFEFRPMSYLTENSSKAMELAYCSADQDKFWELHDYVYTTTWSNHYSQGQKPADVTLFADDYIADISKNIGADGQNMKACVNKGTHVERQVDANRAAFESGVQGTPHFLINDKSYSGFAPYTVMKTTIESLL